MNKILQGGNLMERPVESPLGIIPKNIWKKNKGWEN